MYVVGGHINRSHLDKGNVFTIASNKYAEFNMFLDPFAAKTVFESGINITLVPLSTQRKVSRFPKTLERLKLTRKTPEVRFVKCLLSRLQVLQRTHKRYHHMVKFINELKRKFFSLSLISCATSNNRIGFNCRVHSWVRSLVQY